MESSICNAYPVEEASVFCSYYFKDHVQTKARAVPRNYEGGGDYIHQMILYTYQFSNIVVDHWVIPE